MTSSLPAAASAAEASGRAWGKVILLGEHAVVYGRRAIAASIARHVEVRVSDLYGRALTPNGNGTPDDPRFRAAVMRAAELLDVEAADLLVHVHSDLPAGVGLGSSAAVSVALLRALAAFAGVDCCNAEVCAHAFELERIFHGSPSGIDNTAATHGGLFVFRPGQSPGQIRVPRPLSLVIAISKTPRETGRAVGGVRERWQADRAAYESFFDCVDSLVAAAARALSRGDLVSVGAAMNENHTVLAQMGVSTEELDEMVRLGREEGALGAKLTGGGGGGAILCLCARDSERLADAFRRRGWDAFTTCISSPAIQMHGHGVRA
jgi:hydroxymethylglutaryl-CoA reductase